MGVYEFEIDASYTKWGVVHSRTNWYFVSKSRQECPGNWIRWKTELYEVERIKSAQKIAAENWV